MDILDPMRNCAPQGTGEITGDGREPACVSQDSQGGFELADEVVSACKSVGRRPVEHFSLAMIEDNRPTDCPHPKDATTPLESGDRPGGGQVHASADAPRLLLAEAFL